MAETADIMETLFRLVYPLHDLFLATALASLRLQVALLVLPAFGEQFVQGQIRNCVCVVIGLYIAFGLPVGAIEQMRMLDWAEGLAKEALIGLMLGFAAASVFWVAESVGAYIDTQAGFNSVQLNNPMSGEQSTPVSSLMLQLIIVIFYQIGGFLLFIGALFESYHAWPLLSPLPDITQAHDLFVIAQTDSLMIGVVKFAAPVLLVLMLIDIGFGLLTRSAEKLDTSNLSQPVKGAVTMLILALLVSVLISQVRSQLLPSGIVQRIHDSMAPR